MLFNSLEFAVFYLAVFTAYWLIPVSCRKPLLLAASLWFYAAWDWRFLGLILLSSGTDFLCGRFIDRESRAGARKAWLLASLATNLGILGFFKYFNFFLESFHAAFPLMPEPVLRILLPVGISFFTFQSMSYTIDIYRGQVKPVSALDFFLFVAFFPQLLSGPIVRATEFLPQLRRLPRFSRNDACEGALLFARGFCKKVFLADLLAHAADPVFAHPERFGALACLFAVYAFAFQIYWDFSGYTDMARGSALALGFRFPENFALPYLSASPREFWRRWHMTLSTWLRDYLYKSLGGDRGGKSATLRNLFLTMALGGLWHGANWTFVIWGAYHGALLAVQRLMPGRGKGKGALLPHTLQALMRPLGILFTFHLICLGWIFFRAESLSLALRFLGRMVSGSWAWQPALGPLTVGLAVCAVWQILSGAVRESKESDPTRQSPSGQSTDKQCTDNVRTDRKGWVWQSAQAALLAAGVALAFLYSTESAPFLYFQF